MYNNVKKKKKRQQTLLWYFSFMRKNILNAIACGYTGPNENQCLSVFFFFFFFLFKLSNNIQQQDSRFKTVFTAGVERCACKHFCIEWLKIPSKSVILVTKGIEVQSLKCQMIKFSSNFHTKLPTKHLSEKLRLLSHFLLHGSFFTYFR